MAEPIPALFPHCSSFCHPAEERCAVTADGICEATRPTPYKAMCPTCERARYLEPSGLCGECDDAARLRAAVGEWATTRRILLAYQDEPGKLAEFLEAQQRYRGDEYRLWTLARELGLVGGTA